ncbi:lysosome membrane protein 2-like [Diadema antillarum]|uniref:lysosome membrane protein 2-like n=1 Tax=Diadema antillarum TaxID=105358 RepID=UPI003A8456A4
MAVSTKKLVSWTVVGTTMTVIGIALIPLSDFTVRTILEKEEILVPEAMAYPLWRDVPLPIYMQFWFWNLTNPEEFLQGGPARLEELGPYSYREYRPKTNITYHDNGTVSYMNLKSFVFDRDMSVGPESDTFVSINGPVFTIAYWLRNQKDPVQRIWELVHAISEAELIIEIPVGGFVWGYSDKYLELAQDILGEERVPSTNFGVLMSYNNSDDGIWTVYTGEDNIMDLNRMDMWNREKLLPYWTTDIANALNGTDGTIMHPYVEKTEEVYVFSTYVCRSGFVVYEGYRNFRGAWLYHFSAPEYLYANATIFPPNIDFCTPNQTTCPPTGLLNVSECYFQAPVYLSSPHFLYGDESLFESVIGMKPDKDEHELAVDIDPLTGVTFRGDLRAQVNMKVGPYDFIEGAANVREMYFPLVWLNESAELPEEYSRLYRNYVQISSYVVLAVIVLLISVGGGILVGIASFLVWRRYWKKPAKKEDESMKSMATDQGKQAEVEITKRTADKSIQCGEALDNT